MSFISRATLTVLFIFLNCNSGFTQQSPVRSAFDCKKEIASSESSKLLSEVQQSFSTLDSLKADFYQDSFLMALDESELSAGKVRLLKPGKMRWDYNTPEEQIFIIKDKDIWLYQPRLNQVMIDTLDKVLISQLPTAFLMGVGDLSKDFDIKSACQTKDAIVLRLSPAADSGDVGSLSEFFLLVDAKSHLPLGAKVIDLAGNQTSIILKSLVVNDKSVANKDFSYEPGENLDIDDRRKGTSLTEIQ